MDTQSCLELKKAKFYPDKIILIRNKKNIVIPTIAITSIEYTMPSFLNFVFANFPWMFTINLRPNLYGITKYNLCIKKRDFIKIQSFLKVPYLVG